jgi:hypothetical protein
MVCGTLRNGQLWHETLLKNDTIVPSLLNQHIRLYVASILPAREYDAPLRNWCMNIERTSAYYRCEMMRIADNSFITNTILSCAFL